MAVLEWPQPPSQLLLKTRLGWVLAPLSQESAPFAVIGSNTVVEAKGQRVRGRLYPWGIVEGETRQEALGEGWEAPRRLTPTHLVGSCPQWRIRRTAIL